VTRRVWIRHWLYIWAPQLGVAGDKAAICLFVLRFVYLRLRRCCRLYDITNSIKKLPLPYIHASVHFAGMPSPTRATAFPPQFRKLACTAPNKPRICFPDGAATPFAASMASTSSRAVMGSAADHGGVGARERSPDRTA
jgi:hypothetical protein